MSDLPNPPEAPSAPKKRNPRPIILSAVAGVAVIALVLGLVMWLPGGSDDQQASPAEAQVDLASLSESTTHGKFDNPAEDDDPFGETDGEVVKPVKMIAVYDEPGGEAFAKIGPKQLGDDSRPDEERSDTWLPVIDKQDDDWVRVLLPSKPNASTGWLKASDVEQARSPYLIRVHLGSLKLSLHKNGEEIDSWTAGIGKDDTPTPVGRTFVLGQFTDPGQTYSPIIIALGSHSPTLETFNEGPGTVAIHTWPSADGFGTKSSDGCIRIPQDALDKLVEVPLGTLVIVDED